MKIFYALINKQLFRQFNFSKTYCFLLSIVVFILLSATPSFAQDNWYSDFFLESSAIKYFTPQVLSDLVETKPGFRGAFGYELHRFRFALESGFSRIVGTNPLVEEITITPLVFKFGYGLPIYSIFGLQADLGFGFAYSNISRYESALDIIFDNKKEDNERSLFSGARLYATISPWKFFKIYAGGGTDFIHETDGWIPLPVIEAGLSFKPLSLLPQRTKPDRSLRKIEFTSIQENIVIEETAQGRTVRLLNAVYFEPDTTVMIERFRPILSEAGQRLRANPSLTITLRGYAAPFGIAQELVELSSARAQLCADYLARNYGIAESRMKIESYGALRAPEFRDATWESYRCVELIIE